MQLCRIKSYFASDLIDVAVEEMVRDHVVDVVTDAILNDICFVSEQVHAANSSYISTASGDPGLKCIPKGPLSRWVVTPHRQ